MKTKLISLLTALMLLFAIGADAHARSSSSSRSSFSSSRSFSSPSRTYTAPKPVAAPVVKQKVVQKVTVVQQNTVHQAPSSTSNFMSSMAGSFAGAALFDWLFDKDEEEKPQESK